jgi:integrase/recombinase XerD
VNDANDHESDIDTPVVNLNNSLVTAWETLMYAEGKAKRTVKDRAIVIRRLERDLATPALAATTHQIAEWLARPELAAVTRSVYHSILSTFYAFAVGRGLRPDNPVDGIRAAKRPRRQPRPITRVQFDRLLESADSDMRAMLLLGGLAGLRVHEIARFRGRHIDPEARTLDVTGKGGAMYVLPAHDAIIRHAGSMPNGYWFPSPHGRHVGGRTVSERIRLHMIRNRVPGTPHCLRHFYGTELVNGGADLRVAQELLRHSSLQTTAIYVQASDSRKRDAIDRLGLTA